MEQNSNLLWITGCLVIKEEKCCLRLLQALFASTQGYLLVLPGRLHVNRSDMPNMTSFRVSITLSML